MDQSIRDGTEAIPTYFPHVTDHVLRSRDQMPNEPIGTHAPPKQANWWGCGI